ncbi:MULTISPECIES: hypothetical protein [unclassified Streptomyces]|uniref:hypothetical protein n=1 Tax=unclassified Streptomyces TaxID=2593676 RepID=UPI0036E50DB8
MSERTERPAAASDTRTEGLALLAYRALLEHTHTCEQCVDDSRGCPTNRALARTLRDARRPSV